MEFKNFKKDVEAAEKARLTELLAKKQSEKLESLSEDEIKRRLG